MTDRVLFQTDDALSEANLGRVLDRSNARDYVERGFDAIANWGDSEVTVGAGVAFVHDSQTDRTVVVDADERTVSLADAGGDNRVHLVVDDSAQDAVRLDVRADSSDPAGPSLLLLEADAAAETLTDRNRLPRVQSREPTDAEDVARKAETDALDATKAGLPINTADLSDDAVTAAKIAAAAVESGQIADGAVGVDELAAALGTSDSNPVPGTTHIESLDISQALSGPGVSETDVTDFDGSAGSDGQVLSTDGTNLAFQATGGASLSVSFNDVSDSRTDNTEYQNTTGFPLLVKTTVEFGQNPEEAAFFMGETTANLRVDTIRDEDPDNAYMHVGVGGVVPTGYYYKLESGADDYNIDWFEQELQIV